MGKGLLLLASLVVLQPLTVAAENPGTMLRVLNRARLAGAPCSGPAPKLRWSKRLAAAAQRHSKKMASEGRIGHGGFSARLRDAGYRDGAENVAWGYRLGPAKAVGMWLKSPAHCRNLMNRRFNVAGMARARKGKAEYWTLILGRE
jgi:uncharacterized protein YkwD